jgi:hypothetical protein
MTSLLPAHILFQMAEVQSVSIATVPELVAHRLLAAGARESATSTRGAAGGKRESKFTGRWAVVFVPLGGNVIGRSILGQGHTRLTGFVWSSP